MDYPEGQLAPFPDQAEPPPSNPDIRPLYRGAWADKMKDGDRIPVGGNILSDESTVSLVIDTSWLDNKAQSFTRERIDEVYKSTNEKIFTEWIEKHGIKIDPKLFNDLFMVQTKMKEVLEVGKEPVSKARGDHYFSRGNPKLSEFIGKSECAEQVAVGKLLLDKLGIPSALMCGVRLDKKTNDPSDHAFLILDDPQSDGSLIFDIARPKASIEGFPRILRTNKKLEYSTFEGNNNYMVPAQDVYNGTTFYYGVGHSTLMREIDFAE